MKPKQSKPNAGTDPYSQPKYVARVLTDGSANAAIVQQYSKNINGGGDITAICEATSISTKAIGTGDLSQLEGMLLTQATALQAMFVDLALRAKLQTSFDSIQTMTTLALKCASQSRQAITALADIKLPKSVMFAKQINHAQGPQQVNNIVDRSESHLRAGEIQNVQTELLEVDHGQLGSGLDTRAQATTTRGHQTVAAMEQVHRPKVTRRQGSVC